jgi:quercetin dioxygenase-like cupin family protein
VSRLTCSGLGAAALLFAQGAMASSSTPVLAKDLPNVPGFRMTTIKVHYAPGDATPPHRHAQSAFIMAYVLDGAIQSQVEGEPLRTYHAGETWTEGPGAHHIVGRNASSSEPADLLVVFVAAKDDVLTTMDH